MTDHPLLYEEYRALRVEVATRVKILHDSLNIAVVLNFASIIFMVFLYLQDISARDLFTYALLFPPIFAFLAFNYQANQMTLEATANHSNDLRLSLVKEKLDSWENVYMMYKRRVRMTSFLKTVPMIGPLFLPLGIGWFESTPLMNQLAALDVVLGLLVLINFKFKLKSF